jgi:hypothetical protein
MESRPTTRPIVYFLRGTSQKIIVTRLADFML